MKVLTTHLGELTVRLVEPRPGSAPAALAVICHGYGAPGTDLVGLAEELVMLRPELAAVRFLFPEGPLVPRDLGPWGGRAWWPIDIAAIERALSRGEPRVLAGGEPDGMGAARKALLVVLERALADARLPWSRLVLGGFSQGAMLAVDTALRADEAVGGVVAFSPTLVAEETWRRLAARRRGLRVFVSHGRQDPLLPFAASQALVALLEENGIAAEFLPFDGPHTIPYEALAGAADRLAAWTAEVTSSGT